MNLNTAKKNKRQLNPDTRCHYSQCPASNQKLLYVARTRIVHNQENNIHNQDYS